MKKTDPDSRQELLLLRMNLEALKERLLGDLTAMLERIDRHLSNEYMEATRRYQQYKNYETQDWAEYLDGSDTNP
jgi:hypothetical protein